jgi:hypothetical protein
MPASTSDKFRIASGSTRPVVTSLASPKANGATTAVLTAATGWNTTTGLDYVMYRRQLNTTTNKYEEVIGTRIEGRATLAGTTLSNMTVDSGTEPAAGYAADGNTIVLCAPTAQWGDDLVQGILTEHKQTGGHSNITADTVSTGALTVTGALSLPNASITAAKLAGDTINLTAGGMVRLQNVSRQSASGVNSIANNLLQQEGTTTGPTFTTNNAQNATVTFPVAFDDTPIVTCAVSHSAGAIDDVTITIVGISASSVTFRIRVNIWGSANAPVVHWRATGTKAV